jgi:hypothetical protein
MHFERFTVAQRWASHATGLARHRDHQISAGDHPDETEAIRERDAEIAWWALADIIANT